MLSVKVFNILCCICNCRWQCCNSKVLILTLGLSVIFFSLSANGGKGASTAKEKDVAVRRNMTIATALFNMHLNNSPATGSHNAQPMYPQLASLKKRPGYHYWTMENKHDSVTRQEKGSGKKKAKPLESRQKRKRQVEGTQVKSSRETKGNNSTDKRHGLPQNNKSSKETKGKKKEQLPTVRVYNKPWKGNKQWWKSEDSPLKSKTMAKERSYTKKERYQNEPASTPDTSLNRQCPEPVEMPRVTQVAGHEEKQGIRKSSAPEFLHTVHLQLGNTDEFVKKCQASFYRLNRKDNSFEKLGHNTTITTGYNQFSLNSEEMYSSMDVFAACQKVPSINSGIVHLQVEGGRNDTQVIGQTSAGPIPASFYNWYQHQPYYQQLHCYEKYGQMEMEIDSKCPLQPGGHVDFTLFKPFDVSARCTLDSLPNYQMNGQVFSPDPLVGDGQFNRGYFLNSGRFSINCQRMKQHNIWELQSLNLTAFRRPSEGDYRDSITLMIPVQTTAELPAVSRVSFDRQSKLIYLEFEQPPSRCFNLAIMAMSPESPGVEARYETRIFQLPSEQKKWSIGFTLKELDIMKELGITLALVPEWVQGSTTGLQASRQISGLSNTKTYVCLDEGCLVTEGEEGDLRKTLESQLAHASYMETSNIQQDTASQKPVPSEESGQPGADVAYLAIVLPVAALLTQEVLR